MTKTDPTSTVSKKLGAQIRCAVRTYSFKDRLSPHASDLVRQCDAVPTGSVRGPHQKQTQVSRMTLLHLPSNTLRGPGMCGELRLHPSREGEPTVAHLPRNTSKDPYTSGACTRHQKALRHILLWEYISENMKLQARSNMLGTRLKLPQSKDCIHALSADDLD